MFWLYFVKGAEKSYKNKKYLMQDRHKCAKTLQNGTKLTFSGTKQH